MAVAPINVEEQNKVIGKFFEETGVLKARELLARIENIDPEFYASVMEALDRTNGLKYEVEEGNIGFGKVVIGKYVIGHIEHDSLGTIEHRVGDKLGPPLGRFCILSYSITPVDIPPRSDGNMMASAEMRYSLNPKHDSMCLSDLYKKVLGFDAKTPPIFSGHEFVEQLTHSRDFLDYVLSDPVFRS